jgi:cytochrome bd ubiquinol oxidase subunit II
MFLETLPLIFVLIGLAFYAVLAGADFGAGIWQALAGGGHEGARRRDIAHHAMAPVWEANHVWLIFVLTVMWTAYPVALGSMASTLAAALLIAGVGIIVRGAAYALRSAATTPREQRRIDAGFSAASVLAPFALGAAIGGIASGRVPVGNAAGHLISSWVNATSILTGALAVVFSAYLGAVYLCADSVRHFGSEETEWFRARALTTGAIAGALAIAGLVVLHEDAYRVYHGLLAGDGLPALIVSLLAGAGTLALVAARRYEPARYSAALAVAAVVAGWALAQQPEILPGLTVSEAAASHATLVAVVIAVVAGALILFPSLALLFRLTLGGHLGEHGSAQSAEPSTTRDVLAASAPRLGLRAAGASLLVGIVGTNVVDAGWARPIGVAGLLAFMVLGFLAVRPDLDTG